MPILSVDGADIFYETHGSGPPLLLIAGTACNGEFWNSIKYRSLPATTPLLPSISVAPAHHPQRRLLDRALGVRRRRARRAGRSRPRDRLGTSMGGRVAQLVALDHPATIRTLILASSGASFKRKGGIPPAIALGIIKKGYERYIREHSIESASARSLRRCVPTGSRNASGCCSRACRRSGTYFAQVISRQEHDTAGQGNGLDNASACKTWKAARSAF